MTGKFDTFIPFCESNIANFHCFSPWNAESCPNDVEKFVSGHFKHPLYQSVLAEIFVANFDSSNAMNEKDAQRMIDVGFKAVFELLPVQQVCQLYHVIKPKIEL